MLKPPKVKNIHQTLKSPKKETSLGEFTNYWGRHPEKLRVAALKKNPQNSQKKIQGDASFFNYAQHGWFPGNFLKYSC